MGTLNRGGGAFWGSLLSWSLIGLIARKRKAHSEESVALRVAKPVHKDVWHDTQAISKTFRISK